MDHLNLLAQLSDVFGPPGFEDEVRDLIRPIIEPWVDEIKVDVLGNLIATKKGEGENLPTVMADCHMDEVGFMVSYIHDNGFLRFTNLGGWDQRILPTHSMTICTREGGKKYKGVIGAVPPHILTAGERKNVIQMTDMFIDVGAKSADEVREMGIRVGDPCVIHYPFEKFNDDTMVGKAFDDRAGCWKGIRILEALKDEKLPFDLVVNFAVFEEVGLRGAQTAAFQIDPDLALILECTVGADVPGVPVQKCPTRLGDGPAISVADRRIVVPQKIVALLEDLAKGRDIPYQYKIPASGGTDAGAIHMSRGGVPCAIISTPCRYIHSPLSLFRYSDLEHGFHLALEFIRQAPGRLLK